MEALAEVYKTLRDAKWGVKVLPKSNDDKLNDLNVAQPDYSHFPKVRTKKHLLEGFKGANGSIEVIKVEHVPEDRLKLQRNGRILASVSSVGINIVAGMFLIYGGIKLFLSSVFGSGDSEDSYRTLGKGFAIGGVAGLMTGASHESPAWMLGNLLMAGAGILGLDSRFGLPVHTLGDGLASQGMSAVRYRQEENSIAVKQSIFNNPVLYFLRFLQPSEQAIHTFFNSLTSKNGLRSFVFDEPYKLFRRSAGGLITAGGVLGLASVFKNKLSDTFNSFLYLPYALLSMVNVVAFGRDGETELWRINSFKASKTSEDLTRRSEGIAKLAATPFLAVNNILLGLKGIGIESTNAITYNVAMAFRAFGAGLAMYGFAAQSALKFFKKVLFGPLLKEIWDVRINPKKALENIFSIIKEFNNMPENGLHKSIKELQRQYLGIVLGDKKCGKVLQEIINTSIFNQLEEVTQVGLPSFTNPQAFDCLVLNRYFHCLGVSAVGIMAFDEMIKQVTDPSIKKELRDYEIAFKIACLIHDIRHLARSHVLEKALEGWDNDEGLVELLQDENSEISSIIINHYGKSTLKKVLDIIGHKHPMLYKLFKDCDRMEYQGLSEYTLLKNPRLQFFKATFDDVRNFARTMRPFRLSNGKLDLSYIEVGGVQKLLREFARYMYFNTEHGAFARIESDLSYCVGIAANTKVNSENVKYMTQKQVDKHAKDGIELINGSLFPVTMEITSGDESYVGYSPEDENNHIWINTGNKVFEITDWMERVVKNQNKTLYNELAKVMKVLRTPREIRIRALVSNTFNIDSTELSPSSIYEQMRSRNARIPQYALSG